MKLQKSAIFLEKSLRINMLKIKNILKLEIIVFMQVNVEVLHITLKHSIPKEIIIVNHNGSNYDCHFITKELTEKIED